MAAIAPTPTPRGAPDGTKLDDGFSSLVTFSSSTRIRLWEIEVTPPGWDGGDAIDTTTMHNVDLYTMNPRQLMKMTEMKMTCAYDPKVYDDSPGLIPAMINVDQTITVKWPNGDTVAFYGYLQKFEPSSLKEGDRPTCDVTIIPTNEDANGNEAMPVYTPASGT